MEYIIYIQVQKLGRVETPDIYTTTNRALMAHVPLFLIALSVCTRKRRGNMPARISEGRNECLVVLFHES